MMNPSLTLASEAISASLSVLALSGEEALSRTYRFEIDVASDDPALPLDAMVGAAATLGMTGRPVRGIIAEIEQGGELERGLYAYRVTLAPRLSLLGLAKQTRIYRDLSAPDLVRAVLAASGVALDVELRLERAYSPRSHAVQYQESALDFVSRLLEQAGIGYFLEHDGASERLVLCDHEGGYRAETAAAMGEEVRALTCRRRLSPRGLVLVDYNDRTPDVPLQAESDVDPRGFGVQIDMADPFTTPEAGAALAVIRAEEIRCRTTLFEGSIATPLAAGARLRLSGHFRGDYNQDYLVTRAVHRVARGEGYTCAFEAIPASQPFRPARVTKKPRLGGAMVAHVDARGPEGTAAVDAEGRYRVVMPFDLGGAPEAEASMPMRMATPYGGAEEGMSFTLRKGTEVLWTGVDGDPERPVITGVVPNAKSRVVTSADNVGSRIRMPNGALFEMGSGAGRKNGSGVCEPVHGGALPREQQLGVEPDNPYESSSGTGGSDAEDWMRIAVPHGGDKHSYLRYGEKASTAANGFTESGGLSPSGGYDGWEWSSLDSGYDMSSADNDKGKSAHFGWDQSDGVYDYTDKNRTVVTRGNLQSVTQGNRTDVVLGNYRLVIPSRTLGVYDADFYSMTFSNDWQGWRKTTRSHVSSVNLAYGDNSNFFTGINFGMSLGGNYNISAGINGSVFLGLNAGFTGGMTCNIAYGPVFEFGNTKKVSTADDQDIKARTKVHLRVRSLDGPAYKAALKAAKPWAVALSAGAAGAVFGAGGAAAGKDDLDKGGGLTGMTWGIATLAALGGAVLVHKMAHSSPAAVNDSELLLDNAQATLRCGGPVGPTLEIQTVPPQIALKVSANGPSITLDATSITLSCGPNGPSIKLDPINGIKLKAGLISSLTIDPQDIHGQISTGNHYFQLDAMGFING